MKCFECDKTVEIKKYKAFKYTGVSLDNIVLLNVEVEVCASCQIETPLLRNVKKLHDAIGVAIALQKVHLSWADLRYLRRSAGFKSGEWAKRIGVVEGHYSRLESGERPITAQIDKLARIMFLNALKQRNPEDIKLACHLETVLNIDIERRKDFVIAIDAGAPEKEAKYLPYSSPLLVEPPAIKIEAKTEVVKPLTVGMLTDRTSVIMSERLLDAAFNGELSLG